MRAGMRQKGGTVALVTEKGEVYEVMTMGASLAKTTPSWYRTCPTP